MIEPASRPRAAAVPFTAPRSVTILGATGSIGASTVDLLKRNPARYRVEAVSARRNALLRHWLVCQAIVFAMERAPSGVSWND